MSDALPESMPRPSCQACGKQLSRYVVTVSLPRGESIDDRLRPLVQGQPRHSATGQVQHRIWTGRYGQYGDDRFCGLKCARRWALKRCMKPGNKLAVAAEAALHRYRAQTSEPAEETTPDPLHT